MELNRNEIMQHKRTRNISTPCVVRSRFIVKRYFVLAGLTGISFIIRTEAGFERGIQVVGDSHYRIQPGGPDRVGIIPCDVAKTIHDFINQPVTERLEQPGF